MTASIRFLRSFFASTCTPSALRLSFMTSLLLALGVLLCSQQAGAITTTASYSGGYEVLGGRLTYPSGVAVDANGDIYLAMPALSTVEEIPANCIAGANDNSCVITLGGGFSQPLGVAVDASGNVYVADTENDAVKEIPLGCTSSDCVKTLGSGYKEPYGVAVDMSGNVYVADTFKGKVQRILASCISGNDYSATDCIAPMGVGAVGVPTAIAVDGSGNVYVGDTGGSTVELLSSCSYNGTTFRYDCTVTTLGGGFDSPFGVAVDANGNIYVADAGNSTVSEMPSSCINSSACVTSLSAGFDDPYGVAVDAKGSIYVADTSNWAVKKLMLQGVDFGTLAVGASNPALRSLVFTFASGGTIHAPVILTEGVAGLDFSDALSGSCTTNGTGHIYTTGDTCTVDVNFTPLYPGARNGAVLIEVGESWVLATGYIHGIGAGPQVTFMPAGQSTLGSGLNQPYGIAIDGSGNIFVADHLNNAVKKIQSNCSSDCVSTIGGGFTTPYGIALDGAGNVLVADYGHNGVKEIPLGCTASGCVKILGGTVTEPTGIAVDGSGNIFVGSEDANTVTEIPNGCKLSGCMSTRGGGFNSPYGIAVDGVDNIYVADFGNQAVKEFPISCTVFGCVNTLGVTVNAPYGIAVDANGDVYVGDNGTSTVKEIPFGCALSGCMRTLSGTYFYPIGIALSGNGNIYVSDTARTAVVLLDYADPPSLSFDTTSIGFTSLDSPQTVVVTNEGNLTLNFYGLSTATDFPQSSLEGVCTSETALGAGTACTLPINFTPLSTGYPISESVMLTDNNLNAPASPGAQQTVSLSANGNPVPDTTATYVSISSSSLTNGQTTTVTATVSDTLGSRGTPTGTVTFSWSCSGICSYDTSGTSNTANGYLNGGTPVNLVGGVATLPGVSFPIAGTYTVTASYSGVSQSYVISDNTAQSDGNNQTTVSWAAATASAPAATSIGTVSIGSSPAKQTVTFTFLTAGSIGVPVVVTQGVTGVDFIDAGDGSCTLHNGGNYGYNVGDTCTVDVQFASQYPGTRMGAVLLEDASGNLLATAFINGLSTGPMASFAPATLSTLAPLYNGGTASTGFNYPTGVAMDGSGNIFVADTSNNEIKEITFASGYTAVNTLAPSYNGGTASTSFDNPYGVAVDGAGNVFVADTNHAAVKEITAASGYTTVNELDHGTFSWPSGLAVDASGNVYVSDSGSVYEITAASNYTSVTTLNSSGFNMAYGIAVDGSGNIFVAESNANDVKEILAAGGYNTVNTLATGFGSFQTPMGLAVDAGGNLYVSSYWGYAVYVIAAEGGYSAVTELNSNTSGAFGLALSPAGNLFVSASGVVNKLDVVDTPSLSFNETSIGSTSSDSPQTVTVIDQGNALLGISALSYAGDFPQDNSNLGVCTTSGLAAGSTCTLPIDFTPQGSSPYSTQLLSESLSLTDNTLNVASTQQSISVSGEATAPTISFGSPESTTLPGGTVGVFYSVSFTAAGGAGPYTYTTYWTPNGLSLSSGGILSGTPTKAGDHYRIDVKATDANGFSTRTRYSLTIAKGTGTVTLGSLAPTYTGSPISATATTGPGTYTVDFTYESTDGGISYPTSSTPPTNVGSYTVVGTIDDPNYAGFNSGTMTIGQAWATISVTGYTVNYDGSSHTASYTITGVGGEYGPSNATLATYLSLGATTHTAAGSYTGDAWSFTDPNGNYAYQSGTVNDVINILPATATSPAATSFGSVAVGGDTEVTVQFTIQTAGAIGAPVVVTQGAGGEDFTDAMTGGCTTTNGNINGYSAQSSCTVDVYFSPQYPGLRTGAVLLEDLSGNILATAYLYGVGTAPQSIFATDASGTLTPSSATILSSSENSPSGVALDGNNNLYVVSNLNQLVYELTAETGYNTLISLPLFNESSSPQGVAVDGAGNLFVTDLSNDILYEIPAGCTIASCVNQVASAFSFDSPAGVAVDGSGNLFVADTGVNHAKPAVYEITAASGYTTVTSLGGGFGSPAGVAVDGSGNIFVADTGNSAVYEMTASCVTQSCVHSRGGGFSKPSGVAVDAGGRIFVADWSGVLSVMPHGCPLSACVQTMGGSLSAPISLPNAVVVSPNGNLFVSGAGSPYGLVTELDFSDAPSLSFANTAVGFSSSPQTVRVINDGNAELDLSSLDTSSDFDFPLSTGEWNCTSSSQLQAGKSCKLVVSFTPDDTGGFNESVSVSDNSLYASSPSQTISFSGTGIAPTITFSSPESTTLPGGTVGIAYDLNNVSFSASGGTAPYSYTQSAGTMPPGMSLSSSGALTGTPTSANNGNAYSFTVTARDNHGFTYGQIYSLTIGKGTGTFSIMPYTVTYDASAHTATITTATGYNGVDLSAGVVLTGTTHTNAGSYNNDPWTFSDPAGNYADASGTVNDSILQANASVSVTPYSATYDATQHTASATATGVGDIDLSGDLNLTGTQHTNAGTYNGDAWSFTDSNGNYAPRSGTVNDAIAQATATTGVLGYIAAYDGLQHTASGTATGVGNIDLSGDLNLTGTQHTAVGSYSDSWSFTDPNGNYAPTGGTVSDSISQVTATASAQAPYSFGSVNIESPSTYLVTFTFQTVGSIGRPIVVTEGAIGMDFTDLRDGTCNTNGSSYDYAVSESCTVDVKFLPRYPGIRMGAVLLEDGLGNILATAYVNGSGTGPMINFSPYTESLNMNFTSPRGVAADASGNVYLSDSSSNPETTLNQVEEFPSGCTTSDCFQTLGGGFNQPEGLAVDGAGNVYVADYGNNAVKEIPTSCIAAANDNSCVLTLGGGFSFPEGVAVDGSGNVYVADFYNNQVKEMAPGCTSYSCVTTLGGGYGFNRPGGVAVDANGNVYVADTSNGIVEEMTANCTSPECVTVLGGPQGNSGFNAPQSVAVDANGNVYVTDGYKVFVMPAGCSTSICVANENDNVGSANAVAVDERGDILVADAARGWFHELNFSNAPSLSFNTVSAGFTSGDSPKTVTVSNAGNDTLSFTGVAYPTDFPEDASNTGACTTSTTLTPMATCTLPIDFTPTTNTLLNELLTLTDNSLYAASFIPTGLPLPLNNQRNKQSIQLSGTGGTPTISLTPLNTTLSGGSVGVVYSGATFQATGGDLPYAYTVNSPSNPVPLGLTLDSTTGILSGTPTAAINADSFTVTATDKNGFTGTQICSLTIAQGAGTVSLGGLAQTYTGSQIAATATTTPTGLSVDFSYTGINGTVYGPSSTPPTLVGSYTVTGTIDDVNYTGSNSGTLVISKGTATVTLGNLTQIYNGSELSATAITNPAGLLVSFTYNGSATPPTVVGNYAVVGTVVDANYTGTNSGTLVISKATATVTLGSLAQTYTGSALSATAITNPAGLTVNITYNGFSTIPTAAGNYAVVATVNDLNYTGSDSDTLVISKAAATVTLGSLAQSYTGSALLATAITTPAGLTVNFTYNGSSTAPTTAGNYAVVGTISDANYNGTNSGTLIISKATATLTLNNLAQTYNGSELSATATTNPGSLTVNFTYSGTGGTVYASSSTPPTAAGSYTVVAVISDTNYSGTNSGTLVISRATATVTLGSLAQTYTGSALSATAVTTPAGLTVNFTYNGSSTTPTAPGNYAVIGTISDPNYSGANSGTLVISKATATVTLGGLAQSYTGSPLSATAITNPAGLTVNFTYNGSSTAPTVVGNYAVIGTISDSNYSGTSSDTLIISKATATVTLGNLAQTYNGSALSATAVTNPAGLTVNFTYTGTSGTSYGPSATPPIAAGSYAVAGTISDANYSGTNSGTLVISKATATVTLGSLAQTYNGSALSATAITNPAGLTVNFTYNDSSTSPTTAGTYAVIATINDTNYSGSNNGTLVISKATATVTLNSLAQSYTGSALSATAVTNPAGLTVNFTYNGSSSAPTAAGNYAVVGTINDPNYAGTNSGILAISKATATVTLGNLAQTYNGSELSATAITNPAGLTVNFTYTGTGGTTYGTSSTPPTLVGSYTVAAVISDTNYSGTNSGTLVISKATATVTLGGLMQTYTGSPLVATATTSPTGLTVIFIYNDSSTPPTLAGSYNVIANISDANYIGSSSGTMVISDAMATVTLGSLAQTYTGSPLSATATTTPTGLTVNFTYNGSSTPPTSAGNYAVIGTISDTNYSGSNSGTLVISKAASQVATLISSSNPAAPNNSVTLTATVSSTAGTPTGSVSFVDNTSTTLGLGTLVGGTATLTTVFTDAQAGSNQIIAIYNGDTNYLGSSSGTLTETVMAFTLTPGSGSVTTQTVSSGGLATYDLSIAPTSGTTFPEAVTLTISGMPSGATATITPATWTRLTSNTWSFPANTALSAIALSIQLPSSASMLDWHGPSGRKLPPVLWGLLLLPFAYKLRRAGKRMSRTISLMLFLAVSLAAVTALGGCGGSSSSNTQPSDYTLTVTATSGTVSSSTILTLIVNQ